MHTSSHGPEYSGNINVQDEDSPYRQASARPKASTTDAKTAADFPDVLTGRISAAVVTSAGGESQLLRVIQADGRSYEIRFTDKTVAPQQWAESCTVRGKISG